MFFDELIPMRLPRTGEDAGLRPLDRATGFIADAKSLTIQPAAEAPRTTYPTSWLPTETLARAWRDLATHLAEKPRPPYSVPGENPG